MEVRKFKIGDRVQVRLDTLATDSNPRDIYTISQTLPAQANVWQYRVKRVGDNQERAVSENQLSNLAFVSTAKIQNEVQQDFQQDLQRIRNANARARAKKAAVRFHP